MLAYAAVQEVEEVKPEGILRRKVRYVREQGSKKRMLAYVKKQGGNKAGWYLYFTGKGVGEIIG